MKDLLRQWFGNARPLPLDKDGRVDFSLKVEGAAQPTACPYDPAQGERFMGRLFDQAPMPDSGRMIHLIRWYCLMRRALTKEGPFQPRFEEIKFATHFLRHATHRPENDDASRRRRRAGEKCWMKLRRYCGCHSGNPHPAGQYDFDLKRPPTLPRWTASAPSRGAVFPPP